MSFEYKQCKHYYVIPLMYSTLNSVRSLYGTEIHIEVAIIPGIAWAFLELSWVYLL